MVVSSLRLAWASLASGGQDTEVRFFLQSLIDVDGADLLAKLTMADVHPAQQLAFHEKQRAGSIASRWTEDVLSQDKPKRIMPLGIRHPEPNAEKQVSDLLQQMRVPHVTATPSAVPGGIYVVPIWFPQPRAIL